jgi:methyltransferase family protein
MKQYPSRHEGADTAPGRCIQLLADSSPRQGIVLDLGCGRAPLADQVRELGLEYVGVDVNAEALAEVNNRGYETHRLNLGGTRKELSSSLRDIVAGRPLSAALAVDVLEHLVDPAAVLHAARGLTSDDEGWSLIVSIPNVTHLDIASKLLLGRWDLTEFGLLDDTHLRFFSERLFSDLFRVTGWREVDTADVVNPLSDQLFPADAPLLRPGAPARELLHRLASRSHPYSDTHQFVRRFLPTGTPDGEEHRWAVDRESGEERIFASVLVRPSNPIGSDLTRILGDLAAQSSDDFETIILAPPAGAPPGTNRPDVQVIDPAPGDDPWNSGIASARGRYLCFVDETVRVSRRWIEAFQSRGELAGNVLRANAVSVPSRRLTSESGGDTVVASGKPFMVNPLDILYRPGPTILAAYAIPLEAARATGVRFEREYGNASATVFLTSAAQLCGVAPVADVTVAVSNAAMRDGEDDLTTVANAFDRTPLILPPGSATRIIKLRRFRTRVGKPLRRLKEIVERLQGLFKGRTAPGPDP